MPAGPAMARRHRGPERAHDHHVRLVRKPEQRHADVGRHEQQGGEQPRHPPAHVQDRQSEKKMHDQAEPCSHLHIPSNIHRIQEKTERAARETDIGAIVQAAVGQEVHRVAPGRVEPGLQGLVPAGKRDTQKQCHRREEQKKPPAASFLLRRERCFLNIHASALFGMPMQ